MSNTRLATVATVLLSLVGPLAAAKPSCVDDWVLGSSSTSSTHRNDLLWSNTNTFESPLVTYCDCSGADYQKIWGSGETSTPWNAKFTPITDDYQTFSFSGWVTIPGESTHKKWLGYDRETGTEDWTSASRQIGVLRYRRWDSNASIWYENVPL